MNFPAVSVTAKDIKGKEIPSSLKAQITVVKLKTNERPEQSQLIGETE